MSQSKYQNFIIYWCTQSGDLIYSLNEHSAEVTYVGSSSFSDKFFSIGVDHFCWIYDSSSGDLIRKFEDFTGEMLHGCIQLVNGKELFAAWSGAGEAIIYDLATGEILFNIWDSTGEIAKIYFSPRGTHIVTTSQDNSCKIWNIITGELVQTLEGHTDEILNLAFSAAGDKLLTLAKDRKVIVWQYELL